MSPPTAIRTTRPSWRSSPRSTTWPASRPATWPSTAAGPRLFAISLYGLARAFGRLGRPRPTGPRRRWPTAIRDAPGVRLGHPPRRARAAPGHPRADRQGRRRGGLRGRPARRSRRRHQDQRRVAAGSGGRHGRRAAAARLRPRDARRAQASARCSATASGSARSARARRRWPSSEVRCLSRRASVWSGATSHRIHALGPPDLMGRGMVPTFTWEPADATLQPGADVQADLGVDQGLLAGGDAVDDQLGVDGSTLRLTRPRAIGPSS